MKIIYIFIFSIVAVCQSTNNVQYTPEELEKREKIKKEIVTRLIEISNCPICLEYQKHIPLKHPRWIKNPPRRTNTIYPLILDTNLIYKKEK